MSDIAISGELAAMIKTPPGIERHCYRSREQWMRYRSLDVTASAVACLFGIHPYQTAFGLWMLKTGRSSDEPEETPSMQRGRLLEPVAVQLLRENRPDWQISNHPLNLYFRDPIARFGATPDLFAKNKEGKGGVVQLKSVEPSVFRKTWRDEAGELAPPLHVALQAIAEAHLTGADWCAAAAIVVGYAIDVHVVDVPIVPGVVTRMRQEVREFWDEIANDVTPDPDYGRDGAMIAAMLRQDDGTEIDLIGDNELPGLVEKRETARQLQSAAEQSLKECNAAILHKLGPAQRARFAGGLITAKTIHRAAYQAKASSYRQVRVHHDGDAA